MSSDNKKLAPRRPYTFGPLYDLLVERFPGFRSKQNVFDVPGFARELGVSHETGYKIVRQQEPLKISAALRLLALSRTNRAVRPLYYQDLLEYILPEFETYSRNDDEVDELLG